MNLKFFIFFIFYNTVLFSQEGYKSDLDSIHYYLLNSEIIAVDNLESSLKFGLRAKFLSEKLKIDSLILQSDMNLSSAYLNKGNGLVFKMQS